MDHFQSLLERPKVYYNIDGVGELGIGFMCLGYSLLGFMQLHTPESSLWHKMYTFIIYMAVMLSIIHYGSKAIKDRITYPRTGFVDYRPRDKYWIPMGLGAGVSALLSAVLFLAGRRHWQISTPGSLIGLALAASYVRIAMTVRWKWAIFAIMAASAVVIATLPEELLDAMGGHTGLTSAVPAKAVGAFWLTFVVYGVLLMISGGVSFWLYLRHTQAPAQERE